MDRYYLLRKSKGHIKHVLPSEEEIEKYGKPLEEKNPYDMKSDRYTELEDKADWAARQIKKKYPNISDKELVKLSAELLQRIDSDHLSPFF